MATATSSFSSLPSLSHPNPLPRKIPSPQLTLSLYSSPPTASSHSLQFRNGFSPVTPFEHSYPSRPSLSADLLPVICPSLSFANMVFCKSKYCNVEVIVDENEPEEQVVDRFRREVLRAGVLQECRRRRFFENPQEKRKRKSREAARRNRKSRPPPPQDHKEDKQGAPKDDWYKEEEDNWDVVDVEVPYCKPR